MLYQELKVQIEARCGVRVFGYLPEMPDLTLQSRHLGLQLPEEVAGLREKLQRLAARLEETLDIEGLRTLAGSAAASQAAARTSPPGEPVRLAVARDEAFAFITGKIWSFSRTWGAELLPFPLCGTGSCRKGLRVFSWEAVIRSFMGTRWRKTRP